MTSVGPGASCRAAGRHGSDFHSLRPANLPPAGATADPRMPSPGALVFPQAIERAPSSTIRSPAQSRLPVVSGGLRARRRNLPAVTIMGRPAPNLLLLRQSPNHAAQHFAQSLETSVARDPLHGPEHGAVDGHRVGSCVHRVGKDVRR